MGRTETFHLGISGRTTSPEETFRLSLLDVVVPPNYNTYAIIFKNEDSDRAKVVETFKRGIEATLHQCRHLVGTIQANEDGDYSIVRTAKSSVNFTVRYHDEDFPSFAELEKGHFTLASMRKHSLLALEGMPDSQHPDDGPTPVIGFQLNFIRDGFILTTHMHHFAMDMTGTSNVIKQVAMNCRSTTKDEDVHSRDWEESLMDRSRFVCPAVAPEDQHDAPPKPPRNEEWRPCSWLLFHLTPHMAAELRGLASPANGSGPNVSTYDIVTALCWRIVVRNRAKIYDVDLSSMAIFGQPMDMRSRCDPPLPSEYQGNALAAGLSFRQKSPLTLSQVTSNASLAELAAFIRTITNSVGQHTLDETLVTVAPYRSKAGLDMPLDSLPTTSFTTTDWRSARLAGNDFGVGEPMAWRCLYNDVVENMMVLYPPHKGEDSGDQGIEVMLPFESHAIDTLLEDEDLKGYFEYRGVEVQ